MHHGELKCLLLSLGQDKPVDLIDGRDHQPEVAAHDLDLAGESDRENRPAPFEMGEEAVAIARGGDRGAQCINHARLLVLEQDRFHVQLGGERRQLLAEHPRGAVGFRHSGSASRWLSIITMAQVAARA